jgi:hypothetical protein
VKITDQVKEGEPRRSTATAKASTENFTVEQQAQPTEKFTTWSGEEPKKVLLAARQGETLEEFTARTNQYHEEQAQKAKNKPAIQPFCIGGFEDGSEVKAGEQKPVEATKTKKGQKVVDDPHPTRMMPAMTPEAEAKIKAEKQAKHEQISQSATLMAIEAGKNLAMQPVALTRQYADSLPDGHPKKQSLTKLTREQAAALSPEMRARYDGEVHKAIAPETLTNTPEGWLTVAQKIAQLPMDKQLQVIGSGLIAGIEQYQHDERERAWGRLIGTVQGTGEVLQGLAKIADFGAACILGDNERAGKMGEEFGTALGQTIVGGVRLFQAADQYLFNIGYTGDYAKPFQDIAAAGQKLDEQWSRLPPREQERIKAKLITEMIESGAIGAGGASTVQKASKFTEVLDALAVEAKQLHAAAKPAIKKAVKAVNNAVDELVQPVGDTGMGVKMPIPKDPLKDETKMLMSKADDLDNAGPRHPENGMKGEKVPEKYIPPKWFEAQLKHVLGRLSPGEKAFIEEHNIKIIQVRRIPPEKGNLGAFYDLSENTIYVPEEVLRLKKPVPNYDLEFAFRHEFGHAFNAKRDPFGDYISNLKPFREALKEDLKRIPPNKLTELQLRFPTDEQLRDEVFADMYAHACSLQSNNPRSMLMKSLFPNCLKFVQEMPKP